MNKEKVKAKWPEILEASIKHFVERTKRFDRVAAKINEAALMEATKRTEKICKGRNSR